MVLKYKSFYAISQGTFTTGEILMTRQENGLERKKIVCSFLWNSGGSLNRDVKVDQRKLGYCELNEQKFN